MKTILGGFDSQDDLMHMFGAFFSKFRKTDDHIQKELGTETTKDKPKEGRRDEPTLFI